MVQDESGLVRLQESLEQLILSIQKDYDKTNWWIALPVKVTLLNSFYAK